MTYSRVLAAACVFALLLTAGCIYDSTSEQPGDRTVSVGVDISDGSHTGEAIRVTGNVSLNSMGHNATIHDVALLFVAENGSTVRTITVDQLETEESVEWHGTDRERFNVSVSNLPTELRLRIGTVDKPDVAPFIVYGQRPENRDNLSYASFSQDEY